MHKIDVLKSKIASVVEIQRLMQIWGMKSEKVVFTNGCFDILHRGHLEYLASAANLGNRLIVGLNSDTSVKRLKGEGRPINSMEDRAIALVSLHVVDAVVIFEEETPELLIKAINPDILAKGGDYAVDQIVGADFVKTQGGDIAIIAFTEGYSTTIFLDRLKG
jgi:rfaE bifunctional protein nucleotidyltransferase chain/domain